MWRGCCWEYTSVERKQSVGESYLQGLGASSTDSVNRPPISLSQEQNPRVLPSVWKHQGAWEAMVNSNSKLRCQHERTRSSPGHHSPAPFLTRGASWLPPQSTLRWPQGVRHHGAGQMQGLFQYQPGNLHFLGVSIHSARSANRSWTLAPSTQISYK